jgi:hypothetical protein
MTRPGKASENSLARGEIFVPDNPNDSVCGGKAKRSVLAFQPQLIIEDLSGKNLWWPTHEALLEQVRFSVCWISFTFIFPPVPSTST